jgi:hypothetical protein
LTIHYNTDGSVTDGVRSEPSGWTTGHDLGVACNTVAGLPNVTANRLMGATVVTVQALVQNINYRMDCNYLPVTVGGTPAGGNTAVVQITPNAGGTAVTFTYTLQATDTTASVATALADFIHSVVSLPGIQSMNTTAVTAAVLGLNSQPGYTNFATNITTATIPAQLAALQAQGVDAWPNNNTSIINVRWGAYATPVTVGAAVTGGGVTLSVGSQNAPTASPGTGGVQLLAGASQVMSIWDAGACAFIATTAGALVSATYSK